MGKLDQGIWAAIRIAVRQINQRLEDTNATVARSDSPSVQDSLPDAGFGSLQTLRARDVHARAGNSGPVVEPHGHPQGNTGSQADRKSSGVHG